MRIEAGTGFGSRTRQITMTDNPGTGKHLMKNDLQVSQPFGLKGYGCRAAARFKFAQLGFNLPVYFEIDT
jgi:hypothetical protein